ncbi:microtubule or microtubule-binding cytoskeletal protein [Lithospermum erythrorhizon]|uniref:Dynein light chain n=1 Tax=Lithospermum erythrorhizon TaxID=34254 RepID=A0AAV3RUC1_LITER
MMEIIINAQKKRVQQSLHNDAITKKKTQEEDQVKLAAIAISLNIRLRSADMPFSLQERAICYTRSLLSSTATNRPSPTILAGAIKKEFDLLYGPAWHCVVGKSFGSFVTHSPGGFVYYSVDSLCFLLFKTEVKLVTEPPAQLPLQRT